MRKLLVAALLPLLLVRVKTAMAKVVTVSLRGDFLLEKSFSNVNTLYFRQFVQHYIDKTPTADKERPAAPLTAGSCCPAAFF